MTQQGRSHRSREETRYRLLDRKRKTEWNGRRRERREREERERPIRIEIAVGLLPISVYTVRAGRKGCGN